MQGGLWQLTYSTVHVCVSITLFFQVLHARDYICSLPLAVDEERISLQDWLRLLSVLHTPTQLDI